MTSQDLRDEYDKAEAARNYVSKKLWDPPSEADLEAQFEAQLARAEYKYKTPWQRDESTVENVEPENSNVVVVPPKPAYKAIWAEEEMSEARKAQLAAYKMETPFSTDRDDATAAASVTLPAKSNYVPTVAPYLQGAMAAPPVAPPSHPQPPTSLWTVNEADLPKKAELESSGDPILDSLRQQLRNSGADGICGLARKFRIMDDDGSGTLDLEEFRKAMKESRLNLTERQLKHLFLYFDKDDSGGITYDEFLVGIRGVLNKRRREMVHLAFAVLDKRGEGKVELEDFRQLYDCTHHPDVLAGKRSVEECLKEIMSNFEVGGDVDGIITSEEFESYYSNVSASIDSDDYFELMIRNAWHISGGEGWCANTTNKRVLVTHADGRQTVEEVKNDMGLKAGDKQGLVARLRAQGVAAAAVNTDGSGNSGEGEGAAPVAPPSSSSSAAAKRPSLSLSQPGSQPPSRGPSPRAPPSSSATPKSLAAALAALPSSQPAAASAASAGSNPGSKEATPRSAGSGGVNKPVSLAAMLASSSSSQPAAAPSLGVVGVTAGGSGAAAANAVNNSRRGSR